MTYPGQPGPYGQQQPPSGGWQYGQPGPYEPGSYAQSGAFGGGTQQFTQPGAYGGPHAGHPPVGYPNGFAGGKPPRKKTGLVVGIVIAAVAVIGGVIALVVTTSGDNSPQTPAAGQGQLPGATSTMKPSKSTPKPPSSSSGAPVSTAGSGPAPGGKADPQQLADGVISAYNLADEKTVTDSVCRSITKSNVKIKPGLHLESIGPLQEAGDTAKMPVKATVNGTTDSGYLGFRKESELWCFSGAYQN